MSKCWKLFKGFAGNWAPHWKAFINVIIRSNLKSKKVKNADVIFFFPIKAPFPNFLTIDAALSNEQ